MDVGDGVRAKSRRSQPYQLFEGPINGNNQVTGFDVGRVNMNECVKVRTVTLGRQAAESQFSLLL